MKIFMFSLDPELVKSNSSIVEFDETAGRTQAASGVLGTTFDIYRNTTTGQIVPSSDALGTDGALLEGYEKITVKAVSPTTSEVKIAYVAADNSWDAYGKLKTAKLTDFGATNETTNEYELTPYIMMVQLSDIDGIVPIHALQYGATNISGIDSTDAATIGEKITQRELDELIKKYPNITYTLTYMPDTLLIWSPMWRLT